MKMVGALQIRAWKSIGFANNTLGAATCYIEILQLQASQQRRAKCHIRFHAPPRYAHLVAVLTSTRRWVQSGSKDPGITFFERLTIRANQQQSTRRISTRVPYHFFPPKS